MTQRRGQAQVLLLVSLWLFTSCANRQALPGGSLSRQSLDILDALGDMPGKGDEAFLESFPDSLEEFNAICNPPDFDELYDCHELFFPHMERLSGAEPERVGQILSRLAAAVEYEADAPNYLQRAWSTFCTQHPGQFVRALASLGEKHQDRALGYLNEYLHHPDDAKLRPCISALESAGHADWAERARTHLHEGARNHP